MNDNKNNKSDILGSLISQPSCSHENQSIISSPINPGAFGGAGGKENRASSGLSLLNRRSTTGSPSSSKQHKLKQRFTVIRKLGKGTYGKVQLAVNKETQQEVAIKTIKKTKIENEQDLQRVRREIQIMSSIEHPHIIHIYEVFENKEKIVLVMQYAPGGELYEYVSQLKVLTDQEARRLFRQIATAIFYCHKNKICHRDLKLENILLDEKNNAKLADFGLSNVFDKQRQLKTFCGSPLYASPEIVQGSPYEGPEVDCWSLGVLLYTLVYGAMPFDGSNFKRLVKQISEACYFEPKQRSQASPLIKSLLCADPNKRATIMDICSDPWVNGMSPLGELLSPPVTLSPSISASSENEDQAGILTNRNLQHQKQTPLLKVAQDMANLTPVRLDLLLALVPQTETNKQDVMIQDKLQQIVPPEEPQQIKKSARRASVVLVDTNSIMEVDENEAQANEVEPLKVEETPATVDQFVAEDVLVEDDNDTVELDVETEMNKEYVSAPSECDTNTETVAGEEQKMDLEEIDPETPTAVENKEEISIEMMEDVQSSKQDEVIVDKIQIKPDIMQDDSDINKFQKMEQLEKSESSNILKEIPEEKEVAQIEEESMKQLVEPTCGEEVNNVELNEVKVNNKEAQENQNDGQKGAKKVKKKIVVVKKKRKVAKKDVEGATGEDGNSKLEGTTSKLEDKDNLSIKATDKVEKDAKTERINQCQKKAVKTKGPGKVKIPGTFQAKAEEEVPVEPVSQSRRQSALIADVSQKLLQQLQQNNEISNSANLIKSDGAQLTGVKVSDKKEEFERRVSLASPGPPSSIPSSSRGSQQQQQLEEALRQLMRVVAPEGEPTNAIIEPVTCMTAQESSDLVKKLSLSISDRLSEQQSAGELREEEKAEVERRFSECLKDFELAVCDNSHLNANVNIRDDRSDSVETIKAEVSSSPRAQLPADEEEKELQKQRDDDDEKEGKEEEEEKPIEKKVISTFSINLSEPKKSQSAQSRKHLALSQQQAHNIKLATDLRSTGSTSSSMNSSMSGSQAIVPHRPAPITRSYKKVTFTKDGACITETSKIYSTQGDDGTIRRIERKSKVTHYPSSSNSNSSGQQLQKSIDGQVIEKEEEEEEIIYEEPKGSWIFSQPQVQKTTGSSIRQGKLEKLIMPSSELIQQDQFLSSSFNDQYHNTFRKMSPFGRERTDSASSCSSNSTDVFDDIFDHWTGAVNMFERQNSNQSFAHRAQHQAQPFPGMMFSRQQQQSGTNKQQFKRFGRMSSSLAGSPRCGSAEPKTATIQTSKMSTTKSTKSGYDSDTNSTGDFLLPRRPASGLGSARGMFGSSNFFDMNPFDDDSFFKHEPINFHSEVMKRQEKSLRQRMKEHQKQIWKGSTPSLFEQLDTGPTTFHHLEKQTLARKGEKQQANKIVENRTETIEQSQSTGGVNLSSTVFPLPATPLRNKTTVATLTLQNKSSSLAQLPPKVVSSTSKSSLVESREQKTSLKQHVSTFVELKPTSSSNDTKNDTNLRLEKIEHTSSSSKIITSQVGSSSSDLWNNRVTPSASNLEQQETSSVISFPPGQSKGASQTVEELLISKQENDSRIQSWLQNSIGNLSGSSSGFKSSASDATTNYSPAKDSSSSNIKQQIFTTSASGSMLPNSEIKRTVATFELSNLQQPQEESQKENSFSSIKDTDLFNLDSLIQTNEDANSQISKATSSSSKISTFNKTSFASHKQHAESAIQQVVKSSQDNQVVTTTSSTSSFANQMFQSNATNPGTSSPLNWLVSTDAESILVGPFDEMSLGGGTVNESLDLDGSSSLLDQLRSKGYRSMINQRIVSTESKSTFPVPSAQPIHPNQMIQSTKTVTSERNSSESDLDPKIITTTTTTSTMINDGQESTKIVKVITKESPNIDKNLSLEIQTETSAQTVGPQIGDINPRNDQENPQNGETEDQSASNVKEGETRIEDQQEEEEDDDEDDEDLKLAKASIKSQLERVKETELFLKNVQKEEEQFERQRQQLFMFNNLMLSSKLNGLCQRDLKISSSPYQSASESFEPSSSYSGAQSAPVRSNNPLNSLYDSIIKTSNPVNHIQVQQSASSTINYAPSASLSFEPTFTLTNNLYLNTNTQKNPVEPAYVSSNNSSLSGTNRLFFSGSTVDCYGCNDLEEQETSSRHRGRSISQLREFEQFDDWRPQRRPLSGCFSNSSYLSDSLGRQNQNPSAPVRARRSLSQIRYSNQSQANSFLSKNKFGSSTMMSEYKSAYCGSSLKNNSIEDNKNVNDNLETNTSINGLSIDKNDSKVKVSNDSDSDDGMSEYRAFSYVPQVIPQGNLTTERVARRTYRRNESWKRSELEEQSEKRSRRTSLECTIKKGASNDKESSPVEEEMLERRASVSSISKQLGDLAGSVGENSRLSELEQRIQENKKRREELIASNNSLNISPKLTRRRLSQDLDTTIDSLSRPKLTDEDSSSTEVGTSIGTKIGTRLVTRPSRLESMEARIKRKSYCIRLGDYSPERANKNSSQSLEKWRQNSIKSQQQQYNQTTASTSNDSPRNSISGKLQFNKSLDDESANPE